MFVWHGNAAKEPHGDYYYQRLVSREHFAYLKELGILQEPREVTKQEFPKYGMGSTAKIYRVNFDRLQHCSDRLEEIGKQIDTCRILKEGSPGNLLLLCKLHQTFCLKILFILFAGQLSFNGFGNIRSQ